MAEPQVLLVTDDQINDGIQRALDGKVTVVTNIAPTATDYTPLEDYLWINPDTSTMSVYNTNTEVWDELLNFDPTSIIEVRSTPPIDANVLLWISPDGLFYKSNDFWVQA